MIISDNEEAYSGVPEMSEEPDLYKNAEKKKVKPMLKSKKKPQLTINLTGCKYDSVCRVARRFGIKMVRDDEDWTIFWTDTSLVSERVTDMKRYQKINHFPGMIDICRKDQLARNMNRMKKLFPREYNVFPASWCLPADFGEFQAFFRSKKNKTFISKPESGCQGKGIFIFKNLKEIKEDEHCIVQQYIPKPFILDGFKFDLRIYVLVTSCDPLRIFVYQDGLGRFATVKYQEPQSSNLGKQCMHLTNYAINKSSKDFIRDNDTGSKRKLTVLNKWFSDNGYDIHKIWDNIDDVIIKTLVAVHPKLKHNYRTCFSHHNKGSACFEILGFDILLDRRLKPWLIEVNHSPSFHTDAPLDKEVKEGLLHDTFNLIDLYANDKRKCVEEDKRKVKNRLLLKQKPKEESQNAEEEIRAKYMAQLENYELSHAGGFRRIYPNQNEEHYARFFDQGTTLCAETAASKARSEMSRLQREEIEIKQKEIHSYKNLTGGKLVSGTSSGKSDEVRPESPAGSERKGKISHSRRGGYFRIPASKYSHNSHKCNNKTRLEHWKEDRVEKSNPTDMTHVLPYVDMITPQEIKVEEEMERLAGMKLRDDLVKELGISEQVHASLDGIIDQSHQRKISSLSSGHCSHPLGINEHGYIPKTHFQTSQVTEAGVNHMAITHTNFHCHYCVHPQQQELDYDQDCCNLLHRANCTRCDPGQHSSIKISTNNDTITTLPTMRLTRPHCPPLSKQYNNLPRTYSTQRTHGLKSYSWNQKQEGDPNPCLGTTPCKHILSQSCTRTTLHQKTQHLHAQADPHMNSTGSDLVAIGLSVTSAPIRLFPRAQVPRAPSFHPPTAEEWAHLDTITTMMNNKNVSCTNADKKVVMLKMKHLEPLSDCVT